MANYTYECPACGWQQAITHGMLEKPAVHCECGEAMWKLPPMRVRAYRNPTDVLYEQHLDPDWAAYKQRKKREAKRDDRIARAKRQKKLEEAEKAPKILYPKRS